MRCSPALTLHVLAERLAVCRLPGWRPLPDWVDLTDRLVSVTRCGDELSIVCAETRVPVAAAEDSALEVVPGWRALRVVGPLDFALIGILADLASRLAAAEVSLFALSTFDTDLILVREGDLGRAVAALEHAHTVLHAGV
ncbi:ACT domain-containing protein [Roseospira goensis]|uniref:Aspartate kinase n=1 Tax=Roseospira goensis TaxID=391922 RepID=A0A7W6WJD8_9PROT|nr:ACT domain-containing protein [Roseospira goensis]MBB4284594.1 hypothetical protein [Roseospira goensis]